MGYIYWHGNQKKELEIVILIEATIQVFHTLILKTTTKKNISHKPDLGICDCELFDSKIVISDYRRLVFK